MNTTTKTRSRKTVLVMRTCPADMTSYGGFQWPEKGLVSAPDWLDNYECGNGLHGWLWGEGDASLGRYNDINAKWLIVRVLAHNIRHGQGKMIGKCKFPRGTVVHCGDKSSATAYIMAHGAAGKAVICATVTAGYGGTATAGDWGTATAGDEGILQIKYYTTRLRIATAYVGENGIKPNTKYRLDNVHNFVEVI